MAASVVNVSAMSAAVGPLASHRDGTGEGATGVVVGVQSAARASATAATTLRIEAMSRGVRGGRAIGPARYGATAPGWQI